MPRHRLRSGHRQRSGSGPTGSRYSECEARRASGRRCARVRSARGRSSIAGSRRALHTAIAAAAGHQEARAFRVASRVPSKPATSTAGRRRQPSRQPERPNYPTGAKESHPTRPRHADLPEALLDPSLPRRQPHERLCELTRDSHTPWRSEASVRGDYVATEPPRAAHSRRDFHDAGHHRYVTRQAFDEQVVGPTRHWRDRSVLRPPVLDLR